ncbi:30S ribosomal protein S2 [Hydrogenobacter thermophilus]|uniref:30S ribosomal protein S2 n=1 Tax=Hydrogenobacter thermophilus TaxID=940 RepID=UPI0030F55A80
MAVISMRDLLEAGVHFGHSKGRWNPKMAPFLYGVRNGIHIIDLNKTVIYLEQAYNFIADKVAEGAEILFLGTKKQAKDVIKEEAERAGVPYINERWVGGLLTNFRTVKKSMLKLKTLERMEAEGVFDVLPKKEVRVMRRKMERLRKLYGGILNLERVPDIIWIVDTVREHIALQEARKLGVTVVAIADSNCDPDTIDYPVPGNDDAIKSIKLLTAKIADAVIEGKQRRERLGEEAPVEAARRRVITVEEEEKALFEKAMEMSEKYEYIDKGAEEVE